MGAATIVTLLGVAIIVAAIALYLIIIAATLNHVSFTLGTVIVGIKSICAQVEPVPKYVGIILNDVTAIDQAAKQLLAWGERSGADFQQAYGTTSRVAAT
ncbi:MAG TPA: hypothetical protein VL337_13870 [Acidimicrobiales bacterium]|jgi:hypothetical protein|nr:hypothetical protein [Acidimicrobiales bacterium]